MGPEKILVCMPWGQQCVPSVKRNCAKCGCDVCMDEKNITAVADKVIWCFECALTDEADPIYEGPLVGGEQVPELADFVRARFERLRRERRRQN
jgi:hypothetical protein